MKIGIITSGFENLTLFRFLNKYDHDYIVYYDGDNGPYDDKTLGFAMSRVEQGINILRSQNVDHIILLPIFELLISDDKILPLFRLYLHHCLDKSLIGKIGFVGGTLDISQIQPLFVQMTQFYQLNDNQKNTKNFKFPFAVWCKETFLRKPFLRKIGYRDWLLRNIIKNDLRYFKDASVDTLIPLDYGYLNFQKIIKNSFNPNKTRFHGLDVLEAVFSGLNIIKSDRYGLKIINNGNIDIVLSERRWMDVLTKKSQISLEILPAKDII